jgi:hypothetical protein
MAIKGTPNNQPSPPLPRQAKNVHSSENANQKTAKIKVQPRPFLDSLEALIERIVAFSRDDGL